MEENRVFELPPLMSMGMRLYRLRDVPLWLLVCGLPEIGIWVFLIGFAYLLWSQRSAFRFSPSVKIDEKSGLVFGLMEDQEAFSFASEKEMEKQWQKPLIADGVSFQDVQCILFAKCRAYDAWERPNAWYQRVYHRHWRHSDHLILVTLSGKTHRLCASPAFFELEDYRSLGKELAEKMGVLFVERQEYFLGTGSDGSLNFQLEPPLAAPEHFREGIENAYDLIKIYGFFAFLPAFALLMYWIWNQHGQ